MDVIYHTLSNTDQDKAIFRNLPKLGFMVHMHVIDDPDKDWESHAVGLHNRGKDHFDFGGEYGA